MDRLISDIVVRRTAQVIVLVLLTGLIGLCLMLAVFVHLSTVGRLDDAHLAVKLFAFLASPLQQSFSGLLALVTVVIPVLVSSVCYTVDTTVSPPRAGDKLNRVGHAVFLLTLAGVLTGAGTLVLFTADPVPLASLAATPQNATALLGLVNGIVAFNGVYLTQLMGLKPK